VTGVLAVGILLGALAAPAQEPTSGSASAPSASTEATPTPEPAPRTATEAPGTGAARPIGTGTGSLADIAKKQKEKREQQGKRPSLGVISNESLKKGSAKKEAASKNGSKAKPTPASTPVAVAAPELRDLQGRNAAEWKRMMGSARERVTAAETRVASLESEAKRLENDFYAWSDGNYRDRVIRPAWDQSREELGKARKELDAARLRIADLEEEARKSGALPGWLRGP
jgi:BMFP domain-containing protein YqiC